MVVNILKYIGPFLRINTLNKTSIENQLFHLSKESLKYLVLESKCGITLPIKELKTKNIPNIDTNTISSFSPLLCIYKKANPKLSNVDNMRSLDEDTFKKEILISSNALMTLSIIELSVYYKKFKDKDSKKYTLGCMYQNLAKKQLDFYASYLRNEEGVFVDKKNVTDSIMEDIKLEEKNKKFKYSDQAFLMCAFYKYSCIDNSKSSEGYKSFSLDILKMFMEFKDNLYDISFEELCKLSLALNTFYKYSNMPEAKSLLLDISEYLMETHKHSLISKLDSKLDCLCLLSINSILLYNNTSILIFKEFAKEINDKLLELYNPELGIFIKNTDKKESSYTSNEIVFYLINMLLYSNMNDTSSDNDLIIIDIFKRQLIESGIILSWPDAPNIDDMERYRNSSLNSDDLLEDQDFKLATIATPENAEMASIFIKSVTYNKKKETFIQSKLTFDTSDNMLIFFLILQLFCK